MSASMSTETGRDGSVLVMSWTERAADRSPLMQQSRSRNVRQMQIMVEAAKRLIAQKGYSFTTQELAREAGVALQTFYRHFGGKDQLLLAAIEDLHATMAADCAAAVRDLPAPLARLHYYVMASLAGLDRTGVESPQFMTAEHWRLHQLFPEEMTLATQPTVDLYARELQAAREQGLIALSDVNRSAELMVILVRTVYHHYAFKAKTEPTAAIAEHVWEFCLQGIGVRLDQPGRTSQDDDAAEGVPMLPAKAPRFRGGRPRPPTFKSRVRLPQDPQPRDHGDRSV
jgi:AcrR family transcriptional regulator